MWLLRNLLGHGIFHGTLTYRAWCLVETRGLPLVVIPEPRICYNIKGFHGPLHQISLCGNGSEGFTLFSIVQLYPSYTSQNKCKAMQL